jgi:hypothetical protein
MFHDICYYILTPFDNYIEATYFASHKNHNTFSRHEIFALLSLSSLKTITTNYAHAVSLHIRKINHIHEDNNLSPRLRKPRQHAWYGLSGERPTPVPAQCHTQWVAEFLSVRKSGQGVKLSTMCM